MQNRKINQASSRKHQRSKKETAPSADTDEAWTKKAGKVRYGYKKHHGRDVKQRNKKARGAQADQLELMGQTKTDTITV